MLRPLRVFLCHASQDKPAVRELFDALKVENWIDPWLDKAKILPGQDWEMVIEQAVEDSDVVIVCLSNQSVTKEGYVQREIRYAYDIALEKPENTIFLIPLRLDDCNVPRKLRSLHWVDYFGPVKDETFSDLLKALKLRHQQKIKIEANGMTGLEKSREEEIRAEDQTQPDPVKLESKSIRRNYDLSIVIPRVIFVLSMLALVAWGTYAIYFFEAPDQPVDLPEVIESPIVTPTYTFVPLTSTPTPDIGSIIISEKDDMVLVFVPAGEFTMGSNNAHVENTPEHQVYLDAFWIDQTEVTNAMYAKCVDANQCNPPIKTSSYTRPNYFDNPEFDEYPVIYVNWNMAKTYCEWTGRRLPTEAEWEKAARGTDARAYPWGNALSKDSLLNYNGNNGDTTMAGKYPEGASIYGALDMAGNVLEWVQDWYSDIYYQDSLLSNPLGPELGQLRVLRGGSWNEGDSIVRVDYRYKLEPIKIGSIIGFRCARDVAP